jgi:hypothetical protein
VKDEELPWKLLMSYLVAIAMSAVLLHEGQRPEIAAMPCFLFWMLVNRKWPMT